MLNFWESCLVLATYRKLVNLNHATANSFSLSKNGDFCVFFPISHWIIFGVAIVQIFAPKKILNGGNEMDICQKWWNFWDGWILWKIKRLLTLWDFLFHNKQRGLVACTLGKWFTSSWGKLIVFNTFFPLSFFYAWFLVFPLNFPKWNWDVSIYVNIKGHNKPI